MIIDWSKAPEWATELAVNPYNEKAWLAEEGYSYLIGNGGVVPWSYETAFARTAFKSIEVRPAPWTGEGLPPVGLEVECTFDYWGYWLKGKVLYYGKKMIFMEQESPKGSFEGSMMPDGIKFRPIRTPEQIAEETRIAELNLMIGAIKDYPGGRHGVDHLTQLKIHEEVCINLYDAGWRKQVTP
ncbi:hypothetical protein [Pseudomonas sp. St316]|uniref:hypothetical protein n=1 Tax=Pseudomonas sp. St316 TaxID=2678257 RepID=UPI001BB2F936|nr:hypothetical protein [Pseudomonas sp. St316]BBP60400.1 hypothetical protein PHLH4_39900 [Pseudomonas sp. St316]